MLKERIKVYEEYLLKSGWLVESKSFYKIFRYSDEVDLCAVCEINKEKKSYRLFFDIEDLRGDVIVKKTNYGNKNEIFRWMERYIFGDAEAYLYGETNIKEIKNIRKHYKKSPKKACRGI